MDGILQEKASESGCLQENLPKEEGITMNGGEESKQKSHCIIESGKDQCRDPIECQ